MSRKMKLHYSGKLSTQFWERVSKLKGVKHDAIYTLGCALQNLEGDVLRFLEIYEDEARQ